MAALAHRGPDGQDIYIKGSLAAGHQHFWTVPDEVGERQPLFDEENGLVLVFDGRIDNRDELIPKLADLRVESSTSDARVVIAAYRRWGMDFVGRLLGPFALAMFDHSRQELLMARDAMGDRPLCFHSSDEWVVAASEEVALLGLPWISSEPDAASTARLFNFDGPVSGSTYFDDIREVKEGEIVVVSERRMNRRRYWSPPSEPRLVLARDEEYAERFRDLLGASVQARMRAVEPPSIMLSGGLDSTTIAALAARELQSKGVGPLKTYSWVFDELTSCDERAYIDLVAEKWGLDSRRVVGDNAWPLSGIDTVVTNPNIPLRGGFRELRDLLFDDAVNEGTRILLTGEFGDELYTGIEPWLRDLRREHRWVCATREVVRGATEKMVLRRPGTFGLAAGFRIALGSSIAETEREPREWLTEEAAEAVRESWGSASVERSSRSARHRQYKNIFDRLALTGVLGEAPGAARRGLELRRPYRDRRLIEFMLSVPSHQLFRPGWRKWLVRQATHDLLPEALRWKRVPTSLQRLFERGLFEREVGRVREILFRRDALWPRFVRAGWLEDTFAHIERGSGMWPESLAVWQCVGLELWSSSVLS